jgi:osmotically-inducible protein OsmY
MRLAVAKSTSGIVQGVVTMRTNQTAIILIAAFLCIAFQSKVSATDHPSDDVISYWVKNALQEDSRVDLADVQVDTHDGIVTLTGSTKNIAEKQYADLESKKIRGVRGVIDKLEVIPDARLDGDISRDISQRLMFNSTIEYKGPYGPKVLVKDGNVTLTGQVSSREEFKEAEVVAGEVSGVKSVRNELVVDFNPERTDPEIEASVRAALQRDVYLTGLPITVAVNNGNVTLEGEVGNAYEKERARYDAYLADSVKKVDNLIKVRWWEGQLTRGNTTVPSDVQLTKSVEDELYQDLRIEPLNVEVEASQGHVTLRGSVSTYTQKELAGRDARDVVGVAWVSNFLSVGNEKRDDRKIQRDIASAFDSDYSLNGQSIGVDVNGGMAILSGSVNTNYEKIHATDVAGGVRGVKDVDNEIDVNSLSKYTDAELKARIEERLSSYWETSWVSNRIVVEAKAGKVTLSGEVDTWSERHEAGRICGLTEGVKSVDNKLIVAKVDYPWGEGYGSWPFLP